MDIQDFIRVAVNGYPKKDLIAYKPFFVNMDCEWCLYCGYACKTPKEEGVCMQYRIELEDVKQKVVENKKRIKDGR